MTVVIDLDSFGVGYVAAFLTLFLIGAVKVAVRKKK
jgi:hypothetical protein